jgi:hypothetical protein
MISTLISVLIVIIIAGVIIWAAQKILAVIPMPAAFKVIADVLFVLIIVIASLWVLTIVLHMAGIAVHLPHGNL